MFDDLSCIQTLSDRDTFLRGIEELINALYSISDASVSRLSHNAYSPAMLSCFEKILSQCNRQHPNVARETLSQIKKQVAMLPVIKITLAFEPASEFMQFISTFFTQAFRKKVILDYKINPNIKAGVIIETKGFYKDYSLSAMLEKVFSEHREEVAGMMR